MNMLKRYPGLKNVAPDYRLQAFKALLIQDHWSCYLVNTDGNGRRIRAPYYGDEHWKIRYWRKAITG